MYVFGVVCCVSFVVCCVVFVVLVCVVCCLALFVVVCYCLLHIDVVVWFKCRC